MNNSGSPMQLEEYQAALAENAARKSNQIGNDKLLAGLGNEPLAAERGLAVYANNRSGALMAAVEAAFPVCQWVVGEKYFLQLVKHWLGTEPFIAADLNRIGDQFAGVLAELCGSRPELESMLWLPDLARLEYAVQQSYYADANRIFDANAFAQLSAEAIDNAVFQLSESTEMLEVEWDVDQLWQAYQQKSDPPDTLQNQCCSILIHRPAVKVELTLLPAEEAAFVAAIQNGNNFASLAAEHPEHFSHVGSYIEKGWVDLFS